MTFYFVEIVSRHISGQSKDMSSIHSGILAKAYV